MLISARAKAAFNIQPGEARSLLFMFGLYSLWGAVFALTKVTAYALFITTFGVGNLPYAFIPIGIAVSGLTFVMLSVIDRMRPSRLFALFYVALCLLMLIFRVGLNTDARALFIFLLPMWDFAVTYLASTSMSSLFGQFFDVRQAKRLSGIAVSGRWLSAIVVAVFVPSIIGVIGTSNLLFVAALLVLIALTLLRVIVHRYPQQFRRSAVHKDVHTARIAQRPPLLKNRYVTLIFAYTFLWIAAVYLVNNAFYQQASLVFTQIDAFAVFVSRVNGVAGLLILVITLFVTGRLLTHYGLWAGLVIAPITVTGVMALFAISGTQQGSLTISLLIVLVAEVCMTVFGAALATPSRRVFTHVINPVYQPRASIASDGIVEPLAVGISGAVILLLTRQFGLNINQQTVIFLLFGAAWIGAAVLLTREYRRAVGQALSKRRLSGGVVTYNDRATLDILHAALHDTRPEAVSYALNLLRQTEQGLTRAEYAHLLAHPSDDVRQLVLNMIMTRRETALYPHLEAIWRDDPSAHVRETALRAAAALAPQAMLPTLSALLYDESALLQRGAMIGLLLDGGAKGAADVEHRLHALVQSPHAHDRRLASEVIAQAGVAGLYAPVLTLLDDSNIGVRHAAIATAGRLAHPCFDDKLLTMLGTSDAQPAANAIGMIGSRMIPLLQRRYEQAAAHQQRAVQRRIVRLFARMNPDQVLPWLEKRIDLHDAEIRGLILDTLLALNYRMDDSRYLLALIRSEAVEVAELTGMLRDIGADARAQVLYDALKFERQRTQSRILTLLAFMIDVGESTQIREALRFGDKRQRAVAMERIDTLLSPELKTLVLPCLDDLSDEARLSKLALVYQSRVYPINFHVESLVKHGQTPYIRACAVFSLTKVSSPHMNDILNAAIQSTEALIRETAVCALALQNLSPTRTIMLSTIEKVIILKTVGIFAATPDDVLVEVAGILEEVHLNAGDVLIRKGDIGNSMYIVVTGSLRVHDGNITLAYKEAREVVGELALLDPEPRIASVTARDESLLFRLDQEPFYDLLATRIEVVRGIMRVVTGSLRASIKHVTELQAQVARLEEEVPAAP